MEFMFRNAVRISVFKEVCDDSYLCTEICKHYAPLVRDGPLTAVFCLIYEAICGI
jgi:hypothetical protein